MGRLLSIDYGTKRCGIAVTDTLQIIANGLTTVKTSDLLSFLKEYVNKEDVECFVLGKPMQTNGAPSDTYNKVVSLAKQLEKTFPDIPVDFYDERYTSVIAHQAMLDGGLKKKKRQNKALVDEISACIILQDYMNSKQRNKV